MKLNFRQRLFLYIAVLFTAFAVGIALFEHSREKAIKTEGLEEKLDVFANLIQSSLSTETNHYGEDLKSLKTTLPQDLRITVIDSEGKVLYENALNNYSAMENHTNRLEIKTAKKNGSGTDIRKSASTHHPYLYYAKKFDDHFVRVALPYDIQLQRFLKADNLFLYFLISLFLLTLFVIHKITRKFGNSIQRLRDFALQSEAAAVSFEDDELGEIGKKIAENYWDLEDNKKTLSLEKQKLLQHIQISEEGICFVSATRQVEFYNGLFVQYLNQLVDEFKSSPEAVLEDKAFEPLHHFLRHSQEKYFETQINKQGKIFSLRANVFEDKSFEVILTDITRREKTKQLKKEMTGNIAHELRTPVAGISAYLETIIEQNLPEEKQKHFIKQAYAQTQNLSAMIKDMGLIAKMEEAADSFQLESVNIPLLLTRVKEELAAGLREKDIQMTWQLPEHLSVSGNAVLLYSLFKNLSENAIRYAGTKIEIHILLLNEDEQFYYFSFYDTGNGITNEAHLNRLFERFYRVQEGRTRGTGGTGLGLSIVKNAVLFHKGNISVKNRKGGGLEFVFNLRK